MKFSIKDVSSKCDQARSFLRIWSHLLEKSLMENFIFCAVHLHQNHALSFLICLMLPKSSLILVNVISFVSFLSKWYWDTERTISSIYEDIAVCP